MVLHTSGVAHAHGHAGISSGPTFNNHTHPGRLIAEAMKSVDLAARNDQRSSRAVRTFCREEDVLLVFFLSWCTHVVEFLVQAQSLKKKKVAQS
jgi:hypothetical protein